MMGYLRRAPLLSPTRLRLSRGYRIGSPRFRKALVAASPNLADTSLRGTGQVIFMNSEVAGKIILASLCIGDPFTASMAVLGTTTASFTARASKLNVSETTAGLFSYNGCLMGCAAAVFMSPHNIAMASVATIIGASTSTYMTVIFSRILQAQWTFVFNLASLTALSVLPPPDPIISSSPVAIDATDLLLSPLTGLSQIFMIQSPWTGAGLLLAFYQYSPQLAQHALLGSLTGTAVGYVMGASPADLASGVWGYNAALTSLGVAVCFVPTLPARVLGVAGAAATSVVFGSLYELLGDAPYLNLSFCTVMSACWLLGTPASVPPLVPGLRLVEHPHSPEQNARAAVSGV